MSVNIIFLNSPNGYETEAHRSDCADVPKKLRSGFEDASTMDADSERHAFLEYNADFIKDGGEDAAWPIHFLPCCDLPKE